MTTQTEALESVTFSLLAMVWSASTRCIPIGGCVGWLRSELSRRGFGIQPTVADWLPPKLARKNTNSEDLFLLECAAKRIKVTITDYEITFEKDATGQKA